MFSMANHAYASVWCKDFPEAVMLERFGQLLDTIPFSDASPGFRSLVIRALDPTMTPVAELDLRVARATAGEIVEMAREHLNPDAVFEAQADWDLWVYETENSLWQEQPQRLEVCCFGEEYDDGAFGETGHFRVDVGFEHLFTGHASLLGANRTPAAVPQHPAETEFLSRMARPENLREYHEKTRANIHKLVDWMRKVEATLPVERYRLWSEGEENIEARLDEILAVR